MRARVRRNGFVLLLSGLLVSTATAAPQETERVSVDGAGIQANGGSSSWVCGTSSDGQIVAFASLASNLVAGDVNNTYDVFVHDRSTGATELVSVDSSGNLADGPSGIDGFAITGDGRYVLFTSSATDLVAGDTNGNEDVFVHDRVTGVTERVDVDSNGNQTPHDPEQHGSPSPSISSDGRFVAFASFAKNLVSNDTNGEWDVFVHDRTTGITERVSVDSSLSQADGVSKFPSISGDGSLVAFTSDADNLVTGDQNQAWDIFVHDRSSGVTERVSVDSSGAEADGDSMDPAIASGGQFVAFYSYASNLVAGDTNADSDVFVHDRSSGVLERVSVDSSGAQATGPSGNCTISADGGCVAFDSMAGNLVPGDKNGVSDVFLRVRAAGATERVSVASGGGQGNDESFVPSISGDGTAVAFASAATNLVPNDTNATFDVFVNESCSNVASWSNYGSGFSGTQGVPTLTARQAPKLGSTITVDQSNSYGMPTLAVVLVGLQQTSLPTNRGGTLLVVPSIVLLVTFSYGGNSYTGSIPDDQALCGTEIDLQSIEFDPGAALGFSFTPGLQLLPGL
jgi:Tol biopolymer transport system component